MANTTGWLILTMTSELNLLSMKDFTYNLPEERIAKHPLPNRDQSKLLVWNKGVIKHCHFSQLPDILPVESTLFFNNTKVIAARFFFQKETGAIIEVLLLNPIAPSTELAAALSCRGRTIWKCVVGNLKRWTAETELYVFIGNIPWASIEKRYEQCILLF